VTKQFGLTTDIQDLYAKLLDFRAQGGGDWPESVNEALHTAVTKLDWSHGPETTRIVFLVGDAPPHMNYEQDVKYPDIMRLARRKDIIVNAVQAGNARDTRRVWREIAQMGDGEYIPIPQDGGELLVIETPFDDDIIELQGRINRTVVPYGSHKRRMRVTRKTKQLEAAPRAAASDMASYLNKRARTASAARAVTGEGDLVADVKAGRAQLGALKDEDLPENVRKLSAEERKNYLDRQMKTRNSLNERLGELIKKRDRYVAEARSKAPAEQADSFDRAVEKTLRAQIKR